MRPKHELKIVLASASPRRLQILQAQGFAVTVMPAHIDETRRQEEDAKTYVTRLAQEKAQTIIPLINPNETDLIIAADTTVAYQQYILEKPCTKDDAYRMLSMLSGVTHEVYTGFALFFLSEQRWEVDCVKTTISFHPLSEQQIHDYIASGEPFDKAGGYGIQQVHDYFVKEIQGSYYNVMGLPIEAILKKIELSLR